MKNNGLLAFFMIIILSCSLIGCSKSSHIDDTQSDVKEIQQVNKVEEEPEYEKVSRPIKDFWIVREGILALTESNELYYGRADTANPVFIISNVKEIIISEDGYTGLILLNDGRVVKVNNRGVFGGSIYLDEQISESPDCTNATYDVSAVKLFDENLFFNSQAQLCDVDGNIIFDQPVKNGYVMDYSTNYGPCFNGLFLLEDGTVVHRFAKYGDSKDRIISTNVVRLNLFTSSNIHIGSIIRNNGELLTWTLDEYVFESDPLNAVAKVASNANPDFDSISYGDEVYFVDDKNTLCCWKEENSNIEKHKSDVAKIYYNGVDLLQEPLTYADDRVFVIDKNYDLYNLGKDTVLFEDVKELVGDGLLANFLDNTCCRFDGDKGKTYRLSNVKKAKVKISYGSGDALQVFLKYGGALYASNGGQSTVYKTSFCEVKTSIMVDGSPISIKQGIQSKNNAYMLPYDEICAILKLTAMEDKTTNGLIIESSSTKLEFVINESSCKINGVKKDLDVAPYRDSNGMIWVPIEIVTTGFSYNFSVEKLGSSVCINIDSR